jgi:hypothetical protein
MADRGVHDGLIHVSTMPIQVSTMARSRCPRCSEIRRHGLVKSRGERPGLPCYPRNSASVSPHLPDDSLSSGVSGVAVVTEALQSARHPSTGALEAEHQTRQSCAKELREIGV